MEKRDTRTVLKIHDWFREHTSRTEKWQSQWPTERAGLEPGSAAHWLCSLSQATPLGLGFLLCKMQIMTE